MRRFAFAALLACLSTEAHAQPVPVPGVEVVAEGCSPCQGDEQMVFTLRVWRPGVSLGEVEVRAAIHPPGGAPIRLPASGTLLSMLPGLTSTTILDVPVTGIPAGVYLIEGAILDPRTGVTLDRRLVPVVKQ